MIQMPEFTRRSFLKTGGSIIVAAALPPRGSAVAKEAAEYRITAKPGRVALVGTPYPETRIWGYDGQVPGPMLRARQGERLRVAVENRLEEETTVHWHGMRVPNPMDGVPHLTQRPTAPGETFVYEFDCPDAGTFWYHPHQRSFEQVGRGLYGPLIVEEHEPVAVDRDVTWALDDWRLLSDASISDDFGNMMDTSTPSTGTASTGCSTSSTQTSRCATTCPTRRSGCLTTRLPSPISRSPSAMR